MSSDFIQKLKQGDEQSFRLLIERFQDKVFNICLGFLKNPKDAEDAAQEVFIEVHRSIKNFRAESSLSTWIYRMSVNKSLDIIKSKNRKKRKGVLLSIQNDENKIQISDYKHPGVLVEQQETANALFQAIDQLPEFQKVAFTLVKVNGLSYQEAADITGKSINNLETTVHRAKINLRKLLKTFYLNQQS